MPWVGVFCDGSLCTYSKASNYDACNAWLKRQRAEVLCPDRIHTYATALPFLGRVFPFLAGRYAKKAAERRFIEAPRLSPLEYK